MDYGCRETLFGCLEVFVIELRLALRSLLKSTSSPLRKNVGARVYLTQERPVALFLNCSSCRWIEFSVVSQSTPVQCRIRDFSVPLDVLLILPPPCTMRLVNDEVRQNDVDGTDSRKFERPFIRIASSWRHQQIGYGMEIPSA